MEAQMHLLAPMVELDLILLVFTLAVLAIAWLTCSLPTHHVADHRRARRGHRLDRWSGARDCRRLDRDPRARKWAYDDRRKEIPISARQCTLRSWSAP